MSGYLFSNPQIKKWKTMFFLSFLMNLILIAVIVMREQEVSENTQENEELVVKPDSSQDQADVQPDKNSDAGEVQKPENKPAKSNYVPGEPLKGFVVIEENFFSAFSQSEQVAAFASDTGISNLSNLLSAHIGRLLMWDMVLRNDVRKKDRIDFVFRVIPDDEKKKRDDMPDLIEIIAVKYNSKKFNKDIRAYRFLPEKTSFYKYYYKDGTMLEKIISPFPPIKKYFQVTSLLDDRAPRHEGIDYKALVGSPVYSTVEGTVSRKNWMTKYNGYCIEIEEKGKPFVYKYLHLAEVLVDSGQKVKPGDHIANSGNTGKTTAPHLHYQINLGQKGKAIDPFLHHKTVIEKLSGSDEEKFRNVVVDTDRILNL
ncbi:MAG TPA: M23 family metallopeptidase [bacterium]|nr:M23 family metallopeptidase [bacterium]HQJ60429.1 M23 family metallopeptidase [bacterium]